MLPISLNSFSFNKSHAKQGEVKNRCEPLPLQSSGQISHSSTRSVLFQIIFKIRILVRFSSTLKKCTSAYQGRVIYKLLHIYCYSSLPALPISCFSGGLRVFCHKHVLHQCSGMEKGLVSQWRTHGSGYTLDSSAFYLKWSLTVTLSLRSLEHVRDPSKPWGCCLLRSQLYS